MSYFFPKTIFTWSTCRAKFIFRLLSLDFESPKAQLKLIHPNATPNWTVIGLEYFFRDVERKLKDDHRNEAQRYVRKVTQSHPFTKKVRGNIEYLNIIEVKAV